MHHYYVYYLTLAEKIGHHKKILFALKDSTASNLHSVTLFGASAGRSTLCNTVDGDIMVVGVSVSHVPRSRLFQTA